MSVDWRGDEVVQAIELAFMDACEVTFEHVQQEIQDVKWTWPNETVRKSGEIARSPRSVVDTGELYLRTTGFPVDDTTYELKSDPVDPDSGYHYALDVVLGSKDKPGRNFFKLPVENLPKIFSEKANKLLNEVR